MCGIAGIFGKEWDPEQLDAMIHAQEHRGPDDHGSYFSKEHKACLGHNRLSIIDLTEAGKQPMHNHQKNSWIAFNGEIYNYKELRQELSDYPFQSKTDTEVILAAYEKWGTSCVEHFIGMFAFLLWDDKNKTLFAARDRFGVKPLHYHLTSNGTLFTASEIKALHAAGIPKEPDAKTWAGYLTHGSYGDNSDTFWKGIHQLPAGHMLIWKDKQVTIRQWYDLAEKVGLEYDSRSEDEVSEEYLALLKDSVQLRFRSDVPVGINLSGGVDSSTLLGIVDSMQNEFQTVRAYTFITGDERYDELPWVEQMLEKTKHSNEICRITPEVIPELAASVNKAQDEPFGGLPTLAYAQLFAHARANGTIVLLDGQGLDEQWAGYDYYQKQHSSPNVPIQGTSTSPFRPNCLQLDFRKLAPKQKMPQKFPDTLRNQQYRDTFLTKIPRALRFNDRVSMRSSTELREPFLDHRLFELAMRQQPERKIRNNTGKWLLRQIAASLLPNGIVEAPKRPLQTPQREWLHGPLKDWANSLIQDAISKYDNSWLDAKSVQKEWQAYCNGSTDNSFYIWQWVNLSIAI